MEHANPNINACSSSNLLIFANLIPILNNIIILIILIIKSDHNQLDLTALSCAINQIKLVCLVKVCLCQWTSLSIALTSFAIYRIVSSACTINRQNTKNKQTKANVLIAKKTTTTNCYVIIRPIHTKGIITRTKGQNSGSNKRVSCFRHWHYNENQFILQNITYICQNISFSSSSVQLKPFKLTATTTRSLNHSNRACQGCLVGARIVFFAGAFVFVFVSVFVYI